MYTWNQMKQILDIMNMDKSVDLTGKWIDNGLTANDHVRSNSRHSGRPEQGYGDRCTVFLQ